MKLDGSQSDEEKSHWKVVRTDTYTDVIGDIVIADEDTGECRVQIGNGEAKQTKEFNFGPDGMKIIRRGR